MKTLIAIALMLACVSVRAAELYDITVNWGVPATRTDSTPLAVGEIKNYLIEYTANGVAVKKITVAPNINTFVFTDMPTNLYAFRIAVVDVFNDQSAWSELFPAAIRAKPSAPITKTITWQCKSGCSN